MLYRLVFAYSAIGIALLVSLFWWDPSIPLAISTGALYAVFGVAIIIRLNDERKRLNREPTE